jgi:hypothetical protein
MKAKKVTGVLASILASILTMIGIAAGQRAVSNPTGQFECRDWEKQPTILLAALVLHSDGTYEATDKVGDLTAHRPSATGKYSYDQSKQLIDWTSGGWKGRSGTYMSNVKGTDFVVVHTTQDPEGKISGALRCARSSRDR